MRVAARWRAAGLLRFLDEPRGESQPFLAHLGPKHAIEEIMLLSGDRPAEVEQFASTMGLKSVYGGMSPEQKLGIVRRMTAMSPTLYLGDGINDAPAMMAATAGVALGVNSDITTEAAGAVILQSSLAGVDELMHIGRRMRRIALTSAVGGMLLSLAGMCAVIRIFDADSGCDCARGDRFAVDLKLIAHDSSRGRDERFSSADRGEEYVELVSQCVHCSLHSCSQDGHRSSL